MAIYFIRHAQSVGNINGRAQSHASIELTDLGHLQVRELTLQLPTANKIYISTFLRTHQTAQLVIERDQIQPEIKAIEEFSYLSDARCKNTTLEERKPWVDHYWHLADPDYLDGNDAETFRQFYQRVEDFNKHINDIHQIYSNKHLMVFSHGQFLTLFKMLRFEKRALSKSLMYDFRHKMIHEPIQNTEYFQI